MNSFSYETTFIISSKASDEVVNSISEKVKKIISKSPSQILLFENEGLKKLAYPIQGNQEGYYIYCEFAINSGENKVVSDLENFLRINDSVIRYLTVLKAKSPKVKPRKSPVTSKNENKVGELAASSSDDAVSVS